MSTPHVKYASYQQGINWVAENESTRFIVNDTPSPLTVSFLSYLYGVDIDKVREDVAKVMQATSDALDKELEEDGNMMVPLADKIG